MKRIFISDLHCSDGGPRDNFAFNPDRRQILGSLRRHCWETNAKLYFVGDIFDYWQCDIVDCLAAYPELSPISLRENEEYIIGNHDTDSLAVFPSALKWVTIEADGQMVKVLVIHGHQFDGINDARHPSWARIATIFAGVYEDRNGSPMLPNGESVEEHLSKIGMKLFKLVKIGYDWWIKIFPTSSLIQKTTAPLVIPFDTSWADIVIQGHTHKEGITYRPIYGINGTSKMQMIVNTGSWAYSKQTYAEMDSDNPFDIKIKEWK